MPAGEAGLFVDYCAKDFLDATYQLDPWVELAYRRICDLIYTTNDRVMNDDRMLAWATKTGRRWRAIKEVLTTGERPKLEVIDGRITNRRCQDELQKAALKIEQKRQAAAASVRVGKSLKNLKQHRTGVGISVPNGTPNDPGNQEPKKESLREEGDELGRDAPSGGLAPPDPDPPTEVPTGPELSQDDRDYINAGFTDVVAGLKGRRCRVHGIHDPEAYKRETKRRTRENWLAVLHGFIAERFDGEHRIEGFRLIHIALEAGSREATPRHVTKTLDDIDKLRRTEQRLAA